MIETLLVVVIVALLGGLLYTAMGPAREAARQRQCVSNLRQIGQALRMYIDDYEGVEPVQGNPASAASLGLPMLRAVPYFLEHYVKNREVGVCPAYHEGHDVRMLSTTYAWAVRDPDIEADLPADQRLAPIVARRGGEVVVACCQQHYRFDPLAPRWERKRVILLRLNGQVQSLLVPVRSHSPDW